MNAGQEVFDLVDTSAPLLPARSRLFRLVPIGVGTVLVKSLTSHLGRLAAAHHVSVGTLVDREVLPLILCTVRTAKARFRRDPATPLKGSAARFATGSRSSSA